MVAPDGAVNPWPGAGPDAASKSIEAPATQQDAARAALAPLPLPGGGTLGGSDRLAGLSAQDGRLDVAIRVSATEAPDFATLRAEAERRALGWPGR